MTIAIDDTASVQRGRWTEALSSATVRRAGRLVLLVGVGFLVVTPLVRLQALALDNGASAYREALDIDAIGSVVVQTIVLAVGSVLIALVLGTALAVVATRLPPRLGWLSVLPMLPIVIPAVANVTGWAFLFSPRAGYANALLRVLPWWNGETGPIDVYTVPWIIVVTGFGLTSFVYVFVRTGLRNVNYELLEAAQVSGASPWRTFFFTTLPLLRPVLVYASGIALLLGLGQFTAPLLLGQANNVRVLTTEMYKYTSNFPVNYALAAAIGSPLIIFGVAVVVAQRFILGDQTRFVTHGGRAFRSASRPSRLSIVPIVVYGVVAILLPLAALVIVALSPFYSSHIDVGTFTLDNFREVFSNPLLFDAIKTSIMVSVGGVLVALPIGYAVASILYRDRRSLLAKVLDLVVNLPLGVPAVVLGAGFLFQYTRPPLVLYGTKWVILVVYVTLMLPYATRLLLAGRLSLGDQYTAASKTSGAGPLRTQLEIVVPLMRTAIAGAAALMFVLLTHEFAASLLVRSGRTQVMGTQLFELWTSGSYPQVAAMALVMCVITAAGVCIAMAASGGSNVLERL
jgi:iron(III) transport system permease protein